jgi:thiol-disulfide isomerase/thioredoxin
LKTNLAQIALRSVLVPTLFIGLAATLAAPSTSDAAQAAIGSEQSQSDQSPAKDETAAAAPSAAQAPAIKAPDFTVKDLKGKTVHLAELLAKGPVYLNFWTSWCGPCKREMPELDRIYKTYRNRGFAVVAIAQDDTRTVGKVKPYIDSNKFEFLAATDPDKSVGNAFNVRQYPTSFLIKQDGTVAYFAQGYLPGDEKKIESLVRGLLGMAAGEQAPDAAK